MDMDCPTTPTHQRPVIVIVGGCSISQSLIRLAGVTVVYDSAENTIRRLAPDIEVLAECCMTELPAELDALYTSDQSNYIPHRIPRRIDQPHWSYG